MTRDTESLQQLVSLITGGTYSLSLATIEPTQVLYNGKFSYLRNYQKPDFGGWCHLLLLRSKNPYSKQLLAILTHTPDSPVSLVNTIERVATFTLNFFHTIDVPYRREDEDGDEIIGMTPDNTIFVEYLPVGCFGLDSHDIDTIAVMDFFWEEMPLGEDESYYRAGQPSGHMWKYTTLSSINDLIARL